MDARAKAAKLGYWSGSVELSPLAGGITNVNFLAEHRGERFVVRIGDDIPDHNILRWHELAASQAAHAAGLSPEVVYHEPGALILRFIEGTTFDMAAVRAPGNLPRVLELGSSSSGVATGRSLVTSSGRCSPCGRFRSCAVMRNS
jgi:hypothetical protein